MTKKITVIGLGAMGSRMAASLVEAGFDVTVTNRTKREVEGASWADTPRAAAEGAELVMSMVTDDDAARSIWLGEDGALASIGAKTIVVESSTVTPEWTLELAAAAAAKGAAFLDAPVAGSRPQAEQKKLIYFVGGEAETLERAEPVLRAMGGAVHHVGPAGSGAKVKLAVNAYFAAQVAALGEVLGMLASAGIENGPSMEVLGDLPITAPGLKGVGGLMVAGRHDPMFPIDLVRKDLRYFTMTEAPTPVLDGVRDAFDRASEAGRGHLNISAVVG